MPPLIGYANHVTENWTPADLSKDRARRRRLWGLGRGLSVVPTEPKPAEVFDIGENVHIGKTRRKPQLVSTFVPELSRTAKIGAAITILAGILVDHDVPLEDGPLLVAEELVEHCWKAAACATNLVDTKLPKHIGGPGPLVCARQIAQCLCILFIREPMSSLGRMFGRNHSMMIYAFEHMGLDVAYGVKRCGTEQMRDRARDVLQWRMTVVNCQRDRRNAEFSEAHGILRGV